MMPHTHDRTLLAQRLRDHAEQEHGIEVQGRPIGVVAAEHRRDHINGQTVNGQTETADTLAVALERNDWDPMIAELAATDVLRIIRTDPPPDLVEAMLDWKGVWSVGSVCHALITSDNPPEWFLPAMREWARRELARLPDEDTT